MLKFILSKLLPLFILPLGICFFLLIFNFRRNSRITLVSILIFLWTFSIGFVSNALLRIVEYPWQRISEKNAQKADAIVVLSGGGRPIVPGTSNIYEWNDPDRFFSGIKLFQEKKAPKLFFTGGASPYTNTLKSEGDLYKESAITLGLPSKAIFTTGNVFNTAQEANAIKRQFKKQNSHKILLVTSAFHMQRAKNEFERMGFKVYPFPVDFRSKKILSWRNPYMWFPNATSLFNSSLALREMLGRTFYRSW